MIISQNLTKSETDQAFFERITKMRMDRRTGVDRRSGKERRERHDSGFLDNNGYDMRRAKEDRREPGEQRKGFALVTKWSSVCLGVEAETLRVL
jgi:hypothetical protein